MLLAAANVARLVVGVTAHRDIPEAEHAGLRARVRAFLEQLRDAHPGLPLLMLNSLAEGGDRLVAGVAEELHVPLCVPLPFAREEYERDFSSAESVQEFRRLLAAAQVRELPLVADATLDAVRSSAVARDRQYAQLGTFISSHCQVLLTLWDGHPGKAPGGTAQVVDFHLFNTMPALLSRTAEPNLLAEDESDLVYHISCSRRSDAREPALRTPAADTRWLTASAEYPGSEPAPDAYTRIFRQLETFNIDAARHRSRIEHERSRLLLPPTPSQPPSGVDEVEGMFGCADWLAIHFQRRVHAGLLVTHLLAAFMGLAFLVYTDIDPQRGYVAAFLLLFLLGSALTVLGQRWQWQRKYLDYRGLAEGLRVQLYWRMAGVEMPHHGDLGYDSFTQKQDVGLGWIRHAMRGSSLVMGASSEPDPRWLQWVVQRWIGDDAGQGGQLAYFRRGGARRERDYRRTQGLGLTALAVGLCCAVVLLLAGPRLPDSLQKALVITMGLLPLIAGIREAYSFKKADKELIKQFVFMSRIFETCRRRLHRSSGAAETRALLMALGRACLDEHAEWIVLHRERPLEQHAPG